MDLKVEISLLGDDGNKQKVEVEALSNTLLQFLQIILSVSRSKRTGGTMLKEKLLEPN